MSSCTTRIAAAPDLCGQSHATGTPTSLSEEPRQGGDGALDRVVQQAALLFARGAPMQVCHQVGAVPCAPANRPQEQGC